MLNKKVRKDNKGFTLVELLVVIAIIGILAAVAVPTLFGNVEKSKASKVTSDYNAVKTAVLTYYNETNVKPLLSFLTFLFNIFKIFDIFNFPPLKYSLIYVLLLL